MVVEVRVVVEMAEEATAVEGLAEEGKALEELEEVEMVVVATGLAALEAALAAVCQATEEENRRVSRLGSLLGTNPPRAECARGCPRVGTRLDSRNCSNHCIPTHDQCRWGRLDSFLAGKVGLMVSEARAEVDMEEEARVAEGLEEVDEAEEELVADESEAAREVGRVLEVVA